MERLHSRSSLNTYLWHTNKPQVAETYLLHMPRGAVDFKGTGMVQAGNWGPDLTEAHCKKGHSHELLLLHQPGQDASPDSRGLWQGRLVLLEFQ